VKKEIRVCGQSDAYEDWDNDKDISAMLDLGATHTFVTDRLVKELGLWLSDSHTSMKVVNSKAQRITKMSYDVPIMLDQWRGKQDVLVVNLDDYNIIFGLDFLRKNKIVLTSYLNEVMIANKGCPCFVPCCNVATVNVIRSGKNLISVIAIGKALRKSGKNKIVLTSYLNEVMIANKGCPCFVPCCNVATVNVIRSGKNLISAIAIGKALRKSGEMFLTIVVDEKADYYEEVPTKIASVLKQFEDVMSSQLTKKLPPKRAINHQIELVPRIKPSSQTLYQMSPIKLAELRKQLGELIDRGLSVLLRLYMMLWSYFKKKTDESLHMCVDY